ncbi:DoxX family membrane protein [Maribacter sp. 2-571]|uniref:DoxX family membrane protein n=1 Tax=Maribacter sp. 2-571 TaxID=3417569 RepID=UPI003D33B339
MFNKKKNIDLAILVLRWYIVFYMISYGFSKLTLSQFGVHDNSILDKPIKSIDSFYVAWHLYGRSLFFNISTGSMEIIGGILLIFNRTTIIGSLLVLTILTQVLIIDISFTVETIGPQLSLRVGGMIIATLLILFYYRHKIIIAFQTLTRGVSTIFKYKWWIYPILLVAGFLMDFIMAIIIWPIKAIIEWFS